MPYTVLGSITVYCGVFTFGEWGPKTAIELGQKTFRTPYSRDRSNTFNSPLMFRSHAWRGYLSPVADSMAARRYTCVGRYLEKSVCNDFRSSTSIVSNGPSPVSDRCGSRISDVTTRCVPNLARNAAASSVPI